MKTQTSQQEASTKNLTSLLPEILFALLRLLNQEDLQNLRRTSKRLFDLVNCWYDHQSEYEIVTNSISLKSINVLFISSLQFRRELVIQFTLLEVLSPMNLQKIVMPGCMQLVSSMEKESSAFQIESQQKANLSDPILHQQF